MNRYDLIIVCMFFLAFFMVLGVTNGYAEEHNLTDCTGGITLNETGTYYVMNDLNSCGFSFNSSDMILDCQGFNLNNIYMTVPYFDGIQIINNFTLRNCNFYAGVDTFRNVLYFDGTTNSLFENNTFFNYSEADTDFGTIEFDTNYGDTANTTIINNTFIDCYHPLLLYSESSGYKIYDNLIYNNTFSNTSMVNIDYGNDILFNEWNNSAGGNRWMTWNGTSCDCQENGVCANPYVLDENNTDYLPLCEYSGVVPTSTCNPDYTPFLLIIPIIIVLLVILQLGNIEKAMSEMAFTVIIALIIMMILGFMGGCA